MTPPLPAQFTTPEEAEHAFYEAISRGDLDALMRIWAEDEELVCIHPTGQQLVGLTTIRESWRQIFSSTRLQIQSQRATQWQGMLISVHHSIEHLQVGEELTGPLQATHVFVRGPHGWRMVCRHCSAAAEPSMIDMEPRVLH